MTVKFYRLRDDREGWDEVGEVRDGEFHGDEKYANRLEEAGIPLDDEQRLVETFDNAYFNARMVDEDD